MIDLLCNMELVDYANYIGVQGDDSDLKHLENDGVIQIVEDRAVVTPEGRYILHHMVGNSAYETPWAKVW